jgi:heme exporter protein A
MSSSVSQSDFTSVTLERVRKVFGRQSVLSGVNARFEAGETTLLMGPNGAGKSTLLSIISTNALPSSGKVLYGQLDHKQGRQQARSQIGLLTHAPLLYPELSGRENLLFYTRLYGVKEAKKRVDEWIEHVQLTAAKDRAVRLLSHGMKQRLALGRALLHDPRLVLFDEPFTGLDRAGVELLRDELRRVKAENKIVIIVTHDVEAVDGICDRLLVLRRGRNASELTSDGASLSAQQILDHYHGVTAS